MKRLSASSSAGAAEAAERLASSPQLLRFLRRAGMSELAGAGVSVAAAACCIAPFAGGVFAIVAAGANAAPTAAVAARGAELLAAATVTSEGDTAKSLSECFAAAAGSASAEDGPDGAAIRGGGGGGVGLGSG